MLTIKRIRGSHNYSVHYNGIQVDWSPSKEEAIAQAKDYAKRYQMPYKGYTANPRPKAKIAKGEKSLFKGRHK